MKRGIAVLLSMLLLLTGCTSNSNNNSNDVHNHNETSIVEDSDSTVAESSYTVESEVTEEESSIIEEVIEATVIEVEYNSGVISVEGIFSTDSALSVNVIKEDENSIVLGFNISDSISNDYNFSVTDERINENSICFLIIDGEQKEVDYFISGNTLTYNYYTVADSLIIFNPQEVEEVEALVEEVTEIIENTETVIENWSSWVLMDEKIITSATCTTDGEKVITYQRTSNLNNTQNKTETVTLKATGHKYTSTVVSPTETAQGYTEHRCTVCNDSYKDSYTDRLHSHSSSSSVIESWGSWVVETSTVTKEATCKSEGVKTVTYKRTSNYNNVEFKTETESISKSTTHGASVVKNQKAATYSNEGYTGDTYCSVCNTLISRGSNIPKLVQESSSTAEHTHSYGNWTSLNENQHQRVCSSDSSHKEVENHKFTSNVIAPTYTAQGYTENTCSVCGYSYKSNYTDKLEESSSSSSTVEHNHTYNSTWTVDSNYHWHEANCGHYDIKDKASHTYGSWTTTKAATCTADGTKEKKCTVCGHTVTSTISKTGHNWNSGVITTQPTATTTGVKTYTCNTCGQTKTETVPKLNETWSDWTQTSEQVTKQATCKETGTKTVTYTRTSNSGRTETKTETVTIPKSTTHGATEVRNKKNATTTSEGYTGDTYCTVCGAKISSGSVIPKLSHTHTYGNPTWSWSGYSSATATFKCTSNDDTQTKSATISSQVTVQPTENSTGTKVYTATVTFNGSTYTDTKSETLAKLAHTHNFGSWTTTKQPTCEGTGTKIRTCNSCGYTETETIPATGHNYNKVTVAPTYTSKGYDEFTCTVCGHQYRANYTDPIPQPPHTHSWSEWSEYNSNGIKSRYCTDCQETETVQGVKQYVTKYYDDPIWSTKSVFFVVYTTKPLQKSDKNAWVTVNCEVILGVAETNCKNMYIANNTFISNYDTAEDYISGYEKKSYVDYDDYYWVDP